MPLPDDTHPAIARLLIEGFRRMSASQKLEQVEAMSRTIQELAKADVRARYPNATEREQELRVASRRLDADTMRRAFGWDPDTQGL